MAISPAAIYDFEKTICPAAKKSTKNRLAAVNKTVPVNERYTAVHSVENNVVKSSCVSTKRNTRTYVKHRQEDQNLRMLYTQ